MRRFVRLPLAALPLLGGLAVLTLQDPSPGPATAHMAAFAVAEPPPSFDVVTLVLDFPPGSSVPLHSHPGRGSNILLAGELVEVDEHGVSTVLTPGESWVEERGRLHEVRNDGSAPARLLFTVLVPEGEDVLAFPER